MAVAQCSVCVVYDASDAMRRPQWLFNVCLLWRSISVIIKSMWEEVVASVAFAFDVCKEPMGCVPGAHWERAGGGDAVASA